MATFDIIISKKTGWKGYIGEPPTNETEYDAMKTDMFDGEAPTWAEVKAEMDAYVSPKDSAKQKLMAGEPLTEEEAATIVP